MSSSAKSRRAAEEHFPEAVIAPLRDRTQVDFEIDFFDRVLERHPTYDDVLRCQGELLTRKGQHQRGLEVDRRLVELLPGDYVVRYNLACSLALVGRKRESIAMLRTALECGYRDLEYLAMDSDLDSLRSEPEYRRLLADYSQPRRRHRAT